MSLLCRYLFKQNLQILFICLGVGVGVYILADIFDRLDDFIEAGLGAGIIGTYIIVKIPLMISQILPAVFLLSVLLQLSVMAKNRELTALQAGGLSFTRVVVFFLVYSILWSVLQLAFSQLVGVYGEQKAGRIWKEEVRKTQMDRRVIKNVWFKDEKHVTRLDSVIPSRESGTGITVYVLHDGKLEWKQIIRAKKFQATPEGWLLHDAEVMSPDGFIFETHDKITLDLKQDLKAYVAMDPHRDPTQLPLWQLGKVIKELEGAGSNVESLRTVWHMKVAYAFSLVVMALIALSLVSTWDNIYLNVVVGLLVTFTYYGITIVCVSAGEKGFMPPMVAAWSGNIVLGLLTTTHLLVHAHFGGVGACFVALKEWFGGGRAQPGA